MHIGHPAAGMVAELANPDGGLLFRTRSGGPVSAKYVRTMLGRVARQAGVHKRVHPHGFRHSHAAELCWSGTPVNVIRQQLGHDSSATTARYLDSLVNPDVAIWVDKLDWQPPTH